MVPTPSRRTLLEASGALLATGLAGCTLKRVDDGSDGGSGGDGTEDGSGDGGSNAATDGQTGDSGDDGQPTGAGTYDLVVENLIAPADLDPVEELSTDAPARVDVEVTANDDEGDEVLFERSLDLAPEESRTFEEAFTTVADNPEHVVAAELGEMLDRRQQFGSSHSSADRFTPGGFGAPETDTFYVSVRDGTRGDDFEPYVGVDRGVPA
jgi:hypothetical protein